jgi:transcriptional regulator with XRE-family HTH domain
MFSENLKQARKKSGLSQEELANKLHVSRQGLAKWESGENEPSLESIKALADTLGVSVAFLIDGDSGQSTHEKVTRFFRYGNLLKVFALLIAFTAVFLLFLPGVTRYPNRAYFFVFGLNGIVINPLALTGWILLVLSLVAFIVFFFISPEKKIKRILFYSLLGGLAIAGVLFLSSQSLNPRSFASPSRGSSDEGLYPSVGLGASFAPDQFDALAKALAQELSGVANPTEEAIWAARTSIQNGYWLINGTYYYSQSRLGLEMLYRENTALGAGFISSGILCLCSSLLGLATFWIKNQPIHLSSEIKMEPSATKAK